MDPAKYSTWLTETLQNTPHGWHRPCKILHTADRDHAKYSTWLTETLQNTPHGWQRPCKILHTADIDTAKYSTRVICDTCHLFTSNNTVTSVSLAEECSLPGAILVAPVISLLARSGSITSPALWSTVKYVFIQLWWCKYIKHRVMAGKVSVWKLQLTHWHSLFQGHCHHPSH